MGKHTGFTCTCCGRQLRRPWVWHECIRRLDAYDQMPLLVLTKYEQPPPAPVAEVLEFKPAQR